MIFRIPTPLFGLGLVENTPDATLLANLNSTANARYNLGIGGSFNTSGNDGTSTRFGLGSAEQASADLCLRGLQRRAGRNQ